MGESRVVIGTTRRTQEGKDEIKRLLSILKDEIQKRGLLTTAIVETLSALKLHIISAEAAALFTQDNVKTLCVFAFEEPYHQAASSPIALKCLANLLLLQPKARQYFVDEGYADSAAEKLKDSPEDELLCSRILFLLTYETNLDFERIFKNESLDSRLHENIVDHASRYKVHDNQQQNSDTSIITNRQIVLEPGALTESLKLLFNLNQFYSNHVQDFTRTITPILEILTTIQIRPPALQQPVTALINSLLSLDLPGPIVQNSQGSREITPLFPESPYDNCRCLISILDVSVRTTKDEDLDGLVPLVTLLSRVYELASPNVKAKMRAQLLPSNEERAQPLGKTDSLASHLLRLSTAPTVPRLKEGISSFLFELSDKDAATLVKNVGYGFAAGYLMTHNLPVPRSSSGDPRENVTTVDGREINPITGQRRDMEPEDPLPEMTDEEKEREAERLFVLFERLKATGVMNVVNPVEQAINEGRFEEVD